MINYKAALSRFGLELIDELIDEVQSSEISETSKAHHAKMTSAINSQVVVEHAKEEIKSHSLEQAKEQIVNEEPVSVVVPTPEPIIEKKVDKSVELYSELTKKVYERNYDLGLCFEKNFIFNGFKDNILNIISYAKDDDRKFLFKYFGIIKTFARDVFGVNIELEFSKAEEKVEEKAIVEAIEEKKNYEDDVNLDIEEENLEFGSMLEDIEMGGGCVADMHNNKEAKPSQRELQMEDILNSPMLNKAKELFDVKKITVKTKI